MSECVLRRRVRDAGFVCDENECVFWSHLGLGGESQCAVQYFKLLDAPGRELAEWLLGLKERDEILEALGEKRIGTRRVSVEQP